MSTDPRIFSCEPLHFCGGEMTTKPLIQLPREVVIKFGQQFDVEEEDSSSCELVGYHVQEDFRTIILIPLRPALL
jgi:hypothetical protein